MKINRSTLQALIEAELSRSDLEKQPGGYKPWEHPELEPPDERPRQIPKDPKGPGAGHTVKRGVEESFEAPLKTKEEVLQVVQRMHELSVAAEKSSRPERRKEIAIELARLGKAAEVALKKLDPTLIPKLKAVVKIMPKENIREADDDPQDWPTAKFSDRQLRKKITMLELQRDTKPHEWNTAREMELRDLKDEWEYRYGKEWRSEGLNDDVNVPIKKGDTILVGKWKNKPIKVTSQGKDDHGMPTVNDRKAVTFRLPKEKKDESMKALIEAEYRNHKVTSAIPGVTPGAGKCSQCNRPAAWKYSRTQFDDNGKQTGILNTFHCDAHKPKVKEEEASTSWTNRNTCPVCRSSKYVEKNEGSAICTRPECAEDGVAPQWNLSKWDD